MALLIVEDEEKLSQYLKKICEDYGYEVFVASNYQAALEWVEQTTYKVQLVILDRMLGDGNGLELMSQWQRKAGAPLFLVLSAIGSSEEKARTLNNGADDYLTKPFTNFELMARIKALLRRGGAPEQAQVKKILGNTTIDLMAHRVFLGDQSIDLSNKEYRVLVLLSQHPQRVFPKYDIFDHVWETGYDVDSNVVEVTIKNLRRKLTDSGSDLRIVSKRNLGYWIEV